MQWLAVQTYTLKSCSHILFVVVEFVSFQYWIVLSFFISLFIYFLHQLCWCNVCFEGPYCMKNSWLGCFLIRAGVLSLSISHSLDPYLQW